MYPKAILSHLLLKVLSLIGLVEGTELVPFAKLPRELSEISGIVSHKDDFFAIADSDNDPILYRINQEGQILKRFDLPVDNTDWEALSSYGDTLYIGDFGNNSLSRTDQRIIKLWPLANGQTGLDLIPFSLLDNTGQPTNCDIEAMVASSDGLLLFTKEWEPNSSIKVYQLPFEGHYHLLEPSAELRFHSMSPITTFVTDAALCPSHSALALLSSDRLYYCPDFSLDNSTAKDFHIIDLETISQKESLCFKSEQELIIADERNKGIGGKLYSILLPAHLLP